MLRNIPPWSYFIDFLVSFFSISKLALSFQFVDISNFLSNVEYFFSFPGIECSQYWLQPSGILRINDINHSRIDWLINCLYHIGVNISTATPFAHYSLKHHTKRKYPWIGASIRTYTQPSISKGPISKIENYFHIASRTWAHNQKENYNIHCAICEKQKKKNSGCLPKTIPFRADAEK